METHILYANDIKNQDLSIFVKLIYNNFIELTEEDRRELEAIRARSTGPQGDCYELENDAEGRHGRIMRRNQNSLEDKPWPG